MFKLQSLPAKMCWLASHNELANIQSAIHTKESDDCKQEQQRQQRGNISKT